MVVKTFCDEECLIDNEWSKINLYKINLSFAGYINQSDFDDSFQFEQYI